MAVPRVGFKIMNIDALIRDSEKVKQSLEIGSVGLIYVLRLGFG